MTSNLGHRCTSPYAGMTNHYFNIIEGILWMSVGLFLIGRIRPGNRRQRWALGCAAATFFLFGVSDWLEAGHQSAVPLWLYVVKIACGASIFVCRFTWLGWRTWHSLHREFLFGVLCLAAVCFAIWFQYVRS